MGRLLMGMLFITSLFPSVLPRGDVLRYSPLFIVLFIALILTLYGLRDEGQRDRFKSFILHNKVHVSVMCLFMAAISVSALLAGTPEDVPYVIGSLLIISIIHTYVPLTVHNEKDFLFLMKLLFAVGVTNAAAALVLLLLKWSFGTDVGIFPVTHFATNKLTVLEAMNVPYVMKGFFWQPNLLGMLLSFMLPSGLFLALTAPQRSRRLMYSAGVLISCISIAGAFAFISMLPVFLTLVLFPFVLRRNTARMLRSFVILSVLAANVVVIGGVDVKFLKSLPVTSIGRVDRWDAAIPLIGSHPLFGIGPSSVAAHLPGGLSAHDTFIDTALGSGLPAMILYSLFLLNIAVKITRRERESLSAPMMLTFLSFFILQFFETQLLGGLSIVNFYFLIMAVSYLSISSVGTSGKGIEMGGTEVYE